MEFLSRLQNGERMTDLCREFGINRKTGHKLKKRYLEKGAALALQEASRAPRNIPHKTPQELVDVILAERKLHPTWGGKKLKSALERRLLRTFPAASTISDVLFRNGLIQRTGKKRRARGQASHTGLTQGLAPNDVWCVDYKGQFRLGDQSYCYPLTTTDQFSRFLLGCEGMSAISDERARDVFEELFHEYGLPGVMRSDNGVPFASNGLAGLTRLSVYWLRLGIKLERIRPAHPEENGRHERMHLTLKRETTRPARPNLLQQQERFDEFIYEFNTERPHEALGMKRPADLYVPSKKKYPKALAELVYPTHDDCVQVCRQGFIRIDRGSQLYLSKALAGERVGIREEEPDRWLVTFANLDLGYVEPNRTFTSIAEAFQQGSTRFESPPKPPSTDTTTTTTTD